MRLLPFQYTLIDHPDLCATSSRLLAVKLAVSFGHLNFVDLLLRCVFKH
jgi:hypothetical protein